MLIDTHVHYNLDPLFGNGAWRAHWQKAQDAGIGKAILVGTQIKTSQIALEIAQQQKQMYAAVGIHPTELKVSDEDIQALETLVTLPSVVAVGETGLDYYRLQNQAQKNDICQDQQRLFELHIQIAKKHDLPLIVHVRDTDAPEEKTPGNAYWDALTILQKHDVKQFTLHCVSGPLSYVKAAVEMGGYMGFDGNITYPNAKHIRNLFQAVPEDRRLLETDAPYLPPQDFRGQVCEPWMMTKTAEYIEREFNVDQNGFTQNAERLFHV